MTRIRYSVFPRKGAVACLCISLLAALGLGASGPVLAQEGGTTRQPGEVFSEIMSRCWSGKGDKQEVSDEVRDLEAFAQEYPDYDMADEALYFAAGGYMNMGEYENVERILRLMEKRYPKAQLRVSYFVSNMRGSTLGMEEDMAALQSYMKHGEFYTIDLVRCVYADSLAKQGKSQDAERVYRDVVKSVKASFDFDAAQKAMKVWDSKILKAFTDTPRGAVLDRIPHPYIRALGGLEQAVEAQGRYRDAAQVYDEHIELLRNYVGPPPSDGGGKNRVGRNIEKLEQKRTTLLAKAQEKEAGGK